MHHCLERNLQGTKPLRPLVSEFHPHLGVEGSPPQPQARAVRLPLPQGGQRSLQTLQQRPLQCLRKLLLLEPAQILFILGDSHIRPAFELQLCGPPVLKLQAYGGIDHIYPGGHPVLLQLDGEHLP